MKKPLFRDEDGLEFDETEDDCDVLIPDIQPVYDCVHVHKEFKTGQRRSTGCGDFGRK